MGTLSFDIKQVTGRTKRLALNPLNDPKKAIENFCDVLPLSTALSHFAISQPRAWRHPPAVTASAIYDQLAVNFVLQGPGMRAVDRGKCLHSIEHHVKGYCTDMELTASWALQLACAQIVVLL